MNEPDVHCRQNGGGGHTIVADGQPGFVAFVLGLRTRMIVPLTQELLDDWFLKIGDTHPTKGYIYPWSRYDEIRAAIEKERESNG